ncbi:MAG: hypothetical protein R3E79_26940 [Caldilineaceae bacterium]
MANNFQAQAETSPPPIYQIRIKGHLGHRWRAQFEGMRITLTEDGDTLLTGPVLDQAALYGLLRKVQDLGMPLLAVNRVAAGQADHSECNQ